MKGVQLILDLKFKKEVNLLEIRVSVWTSQIVSKQVVSLKKLQVNTEEIVRASKTPGHKLSILHSNSLETISSVNQKKNWKLDRNEQKTLMIRQHTLCDRRRKVQEVIWIWKFKIVSTVAWARIRNTWRFLTILWILGMPTRSIHTLVVKGVCWIHWTCHVNQIKQQLDQCLCYLNIVQRGQTHSRVLSCTEVQWCQGTR